MVVVLYQMRLEHGNAFKTIVRPNSELSLYIFDNSPQPQHDQSEFGSNVYYIHDGSNPGLSYAYNRAAEYGEQIGAQWLLLLDQDTYFPEDIINKYLRAIAESPDVKLFAPLMQIAGGRYISPVKYGIFSMRAHKNKICGVLDSSRFGVINSGMFVNIDSFEAVGGYNEKVWLDHSDYEFLRRYSSKYDKLFVLDVVCHQEFSNEVQTKEQKLARFAIFCDCLRQCEYTSASGKIRRFVTIHKRSLSLMIRLRSLKPFFIAIKKH